MELPKPAPVPTATIPKSTHPAAPIRGCRPTTPTPTSAAAQHKGSCCGSRCRAGSVGRGRCSGLRLCQPLQLFPVVIRHWHSPGA